jgi:hypothetical protein
MMPADDEMHQSCPEMQNPGTGRGDHQFETAELRVLAHFCAVTARRLRNLWQARDIFVSTPWPRFSAY